MLDLILSLFPDTNIDLNPSRVKDDIFSVSSSLSGVTERGHILAIQKMNSIHHKESDTQSESVFC